MIAFRELPSAEWPKLIEQGLYPYATVGLPGDNGHWRILVAEDKTGQIVGHTSVHTQIHWDPWYVASNQEGLSIVRGLVRQGRDLLQSLSIDHAFCTIDDAHIITQDLAKRLGFIAAPGKLYLLNLSELKGF